MDTPIINDPNIPFQTWRQAYLYGKNNFIGEYWNESAKVSINVTAKRLRKLIGPSVSSRSVSKQVHMKAYFQIPAIIKSGILVSREPCKKGDKNVKEVLNFDAVVSINSLDYAVHFLVKAFVEESQGNNLHFYEVQEMVMVEKQETESL